MKTNSPHILLVGFKRAGKDTVAELLTKTLERAGHDVKVRALARPIKDTCKDLFDWTEDQVAGPVKEKIDRFWGFSPRRAQQLLGTEFGRALDPDLWVKMWWNDAYDDSSFIRIAPDGRFLNEAAYFKEMGGQVWLIRRPGCEPGEHASERDQGTNAMLGMADTVILNDGDLTQLEWGVQLAAERYLIKHPK